MKKYMAPIEKKQKVLDKIEKCIAGNERKQERFLSFCEGYLFCDSLKKEENEKQAV